MNDPLDAVSVTGDEAAEEKRDDLARKLRTYLERMPAEWRRLFLEQFQRISSAELAQLRATVAEQARQLDEAREIIGVAKNDYQSDVQDGVDSYDKGQRCIDWLAANPAPQDPQP